MLALDSIHDGTWSPWVNEGSVEDSLVPVGHGLAEGPATSFLGPRRTRVFEGLRLKFSAEIEKRACLPFYVYKLTIYGYMCAHMSVTNVCI